MKLRRDPVVPPKKRAAPMALTSTATATATTKQKTTTMIHDGDAPASGFKVGTKKAAAARELLQHTLELGVPLGADVATKIQAAELAIGKKHDARVDDADMQRAVRYHEQAAALVPARQSDLFGFTRVVDAKVSLDPATLAILVSAVGDDDALKRAIDRGPGDGAITWHAPKDPVELVASLVRQLVLGAGSSKQLSLSPALSSWLDGALAGVGVKRAMGGAGAFAANLAAAVGVDATFFSADSLPAQIVERFAPGVKVANRSGDVVQVKESAAGDVAARVNTATEYGAGVHYPLFGAETVVVNGVDVRVLPKETGRVILGTQAKDVKPGFDGVDDNALAKIARATDVFFFVGAHYHTQGTHDEAVAAASSLARSLDVMKHANPSLLRHAQYVVAKEPANEAAVWGALKGHLDSLALNSVEAAPFVDALFDGKLSAVDLDPHTPKDAAEDPSHMLEAALAIGDALSLQRIALHGLEGDLVVSRPGTPGAEDPNRQRLALMKARQLASNKAANEHGEIKSADDVWPVVPSVRGTGLAALHRFADAVQHRFGLSDAERSLVVERWWFQAPDGTVIHFVPSRGLHDRTGGTVSTGDTIDASALLYAVTPKRRAHIVGNAVV